MGTAITIRNVPERVRDELAARAARSGRSPQEYLLLHLTELVEKPTMEEWVERVRAANALIPRPSRGPRYSPIGPVRARP